MHVRLRRVLSSNWYRSRTGRFHPRPLKVRLPATTKIFFVRVTVAAAPAALAASLVLTGAPALSVTVSPQVRHLVYSFTWGPRPVARS